ncbi:RNA polymerase factor sigma-54 [Rhodohalobacter mucosus]|uniref:RNA polymerase sigma-54 factor n=1 Tax=Rhodohalobacter mucosus TaxID=2079485 RepID=A0A316TRY5_9BACT|nr:RNA polymerase factor sigma-54 [Rhodohalobacter mucosus]PWN06079.1 RNA polymerase sigma-54 factor [Rhodohalobacter mucosus]
MLKTGQNISQKQSLQQKLSPQQIQFVKLLQLPTIGLEQRIKEEIELNPVLEEADPAATEESLSEKEAEWERENPEEQKSEDEPDIDPVDQNEDIDWDSFLHNTEYDGTGYSGSSSPSGSADEDWRDLPNPYHETLLEELEQQVTLLDLNDEEMLIADQILGSLDEDGYFRREIEAVVDNIAFNHGKLVSAAQVEDVRQKIQELEPVGIASRDLRDCLICQARLSDGDSEIRDLAVTMLKDEWDAFEKKHFDKLRKRLDADDETLKEVFDFIRGLNPRPGAVSDPESDSRNYIEPDFEVYYEPAGEEGEEDGEFVIRLNQRNIPPLRISPDYKRMWDQLKKESGKGEGKQARNFIRDKVESAQWFIDSIRQRQQTLMTTMRTIVALQDDFFKHGDGLKPMILKDVAERIGMDISTVSRVVNGKYVQTNFGVYELKYFFSEGLETESGDDVSSREVKNILQRVIDNEDKKKPLSDQALTDILREKGFKVARRTVSKYREQLQIPVARLRKQIV